MRQVLELSFEYRDFLALCTRQSRLRRVFSSQLDELVGFIIQ